MPETTRQSDINRLRELGRKIAELAALPDQERNRKIWTAVNDGKMISPAVLARDYPVYLLPVGDELTATCEDEFLRTVEADLLLKIYEWEHIRCHRVIEPWVNCQAAITDTGLGVEASSPGADDITTVASEAVSSAKHFERIMSSEADLAMIKDPVVTHDEKETARRLSLLHDVFDGVIDVKLFGQSFFQFVPWDDLLSWMGIEEGMYDFVLNPDFMHAAIARYTDAFIARVKQYEELGLLSSNNANVITGAGGYGYTTRLPKPPESGMGARLKDTWGSAADQIFTSISPEMSREFAFEPEKKYTDLFGYLYYGCCERLDQKLEELKAFPNLKKISMSPYARIEEGMEKMGGTDMVVSFKPNSNYLATDNAEYGLLRDELVKVCELARKYDCNVEILMKTIITLRGEPQRLWKWCDLAMEVVADY